MNNIVKMDIKMAVTEPKTDPIQRMKAAVARMATENVKFQDKMVGFQDVMGELERQMDKLGDSFQGFQRSLERINVKPLRRRSLLLASIMDEDCLEGPFVNAA